MLRARSLLALCALLALTLSACQSKPIDTVGTSVASGDRLWGRLPPGRTQQGFTFEGVERSVVHFTVRSDDPDEAAPIVRLFDPQGKQIDIAPDTVSQPGAATVKVEAVPLLRNGTYRVVAVPAKPGRSVWYSFQHKLEIPQGEPERISVNGMDPTPVHVAAPRGALIAFRVEPAKGHRVIPELRGVEDPNGGRALDKTVTPRGALPPRISELDNGGFVLTFTAPRTGRYTMLPAAKGEGRGVVVTSSKLKLPSRTQRHVAHSNAGALTGRVTASGIRSRRAAQDRLRPMPPLPQTATPVRTAPSTPALAPMAPPARVTPSNAMPPAAPMAPPIAPPMPAAPMAPPASVVPPPMPAPSVRTPAPAPGQPAFPHYPAPPIDPPPMAPPIDPPPAGAAADPLLAPGVAGVRGRPLPALPPLPPSGPPKADTGTR